MVVDTGTYPPEWLTSEIQAEIYQRAEWRCEHCGIEFVPGTTIAREAKRRDGKPMILTCHHLDGNPANCDYTNLVALCQRCHLHVQGKWRPGGVLPPEWGVPDWIEKRGLEYRQVVQHELFD